MRRILFAHRPQRGCWGRAFPEQNRIELHPTMDQRTELEIALHEGLHVIFPAVPENAIEDAGRRLSDLLWRLGFRKDE